MSSGPRVRIGVVGGGLIAQVAHLPHLDQLRDRFDLVALAEPSRAVREALSLKHRIPRSFPDFHAMIAAAPIDAVLICSPNGTHAEAVLAALEAGLHVLVEKPLCITLADADRVIAARDRAGKVVQVGYMKRYDRAYEALITDLAADPRPLQYVSVVTYDPGLARFFAPAGVPPATDVPPGVIEAGRRSLVAQVGEAVGSEDQHVVQAFSEVFLGALVHDVNLCHGVFEALGAGAPGPVLDAASWDAGGAATIALEAGGRWVMTWLHLPGMHEFRERLELYFDDAVRSLTFPAPYLFQAPAIYECRAGSEGEAGTQTVGSYAASFRAELSHFHRCVVDERCPVRTPPEQARTDLERLTAMYHATAGAAR